MKVRAKLLVKSVLSSCGLIEPARKIRKIIIGSLLALETLLFTFLAFLLYPALIFCKIISGRTIKFCEIDAMRIGNLAVEAELFLRRLRSGYYKEENCIYICFCGSFPISNHQLFSMFRRLIFISKSRFLAKVLTITFMKKTEFYRNLVFSATEYHEFNNLSAVLSFTETEEKKGKELLLKMGIKENDWFVCFHSRDGAYLGKGWEYHDYRDSDVYNCLKAAEYIAQQGGYAIRMGSVVEKPLPKNRHHRIIDYALDYRSDFMDIYLSAKCKFFLGNTSGLFVIATIFNVPTVNVNYTPFDAAPFRKIDLYIPKKLWDVVKKRYLTFKEITLSPVCFATLTEEFNKTGLQNIENTADEIQDLVIEMNMRLDRKYIDTQESESLQKKFWALFNPRHRGYSSPARVGTKFLMDNRNLLE